MLPEIILSKPCQRKAEFAGVYEPLENLSFNANYSFMHLKYHIVGCPKHQINAGGTYKWKKFIFNASLQHVQDLYTQTLPAEETGSYTLFNSKIAFRFSKYLDMFVKGENLTNTKYYINYGYPMPGIVVFGGINLHLKPE